MKNDLFMCVFCRKLYIIYLTSNIDLMSLKSKKIKKNTIHYFVIDGNNNLYIK